MSDLREFIAETRSEAVKRAASHFGVPESRLTVLEPPSTFEISGLAPRVLVLASVGEEPVELGPVGTFIAGIIERLGLDSEPRVTEAADGDETVVTIEGRAVAYLRRQRGVEAGLTHLAECLAARTEGLARARVELSDRGGRGDRDRGGRGDRDRGARDGGRGRDRDRGGRGGRSGARDGARDGARGGDRDRGRGGRDGSRGDRGGRDRDRDRGGRERGGREGGSRSLDPDAEARLENMARDAAAQVRASGEATELGEMSSRERWVVHNALREEDGIRSESVGEGRDRRVKIVRE